MKFKYLVKYYKANKPVYKIIEQDINNTNYTNWDMLQKAHFIICISDTHDCGMIFKDVEGYIQN